MKANELMIGDYVYNHRNWKCPIVEIHKDSAVVIARHYGEEEFELCDLRPIPLTPEILEKNGFKQNGIPNSVASIKDMDWCDDTYVWSRQETPDERMFVSVYMDDPANFFVEVYCQYCHADGIHVKYLHELQHALKLCKIDKDIVL